MLPTVETVFFKVVFAHGVIIVGLSSVAYVMLPVVGAKRLIPQEWRRHKEFDNIHKLDGVAVITVQLRYNGWITEMQNPEVQHDLQQVHSNRSCTLLFTPACCLNEPKSHCQLAVVQAKWAAEAMC